MSKNKKELTIEISNGVIPDKELDSIERVNFIIIADDDKVLKKSLKAIAKVYEENKKVDINVIISNNYEKLKSVYKKS